MPRPITVKTILELELQATILAEDEKAAHDTLDAIIEHRLETIRTFISYLLTQEGVQLGSGR